MRVKFLVYAGGILILGNLTGKLNHELSEKCDYPNARVGRNSFRR